LGVCLVAVRAEEPPHVEFAQRLRASHYADLAIEYLEKVRKTAPADLLPSIDLEIARARLDLARSEQDAAKKPALFGQAREGFEAFLKNNPKSSQASEAKLEITSIAVSQAKSQLQKALRETSRAAKQAEALKARPLLEDAVKQLDVGIKELDLRLVKYDEAKSKKELDEKKALEEAKAKAELDRGVLLLDEASTYLSSDDAEQNKQRAEVVKRARILLTKTEKESDTRSAIHWQAQAWICKCVYEDGDPAAARARLEKIINTTSGSANLPGIDVGKRLATYFLIQIAPEAPLPKKDPTRERYDLAQGWIKSYPRDLDTPEGQHVRYLLGEASIALAQELVKDNSKKQQANEYYLQAEKLFQGLEQTENEYTDRARQQRVSVVFTRTGAEKAKIADLPTFEACYSRALFEASQIEKDAKDKNVKDFEAKRKERNENMVAALQRGLKLAATQRTKLPETELNNATAMLVYSCLTSGKNNEAIRLGESWVREKPLSNQAATIAMYTLQAYSQLLGEGKLSDEQDEEVRKKMEALAKYVAERWPGDAAGDMAHFQMGLLAVRDKKFPEAVEELSQVKPTFGAIVHAKYHLAASAFQVSRDKGAEKDKATGTAKEKLAKEEQSYKDRAVRALETLPNLPAGSDPATTQLYLQAKIQLGQHLFTVKKYDEMEKLADPLLRRLVELRFPSQETRELARTSLTLLMLYAAYGRAEAELSAGKPAQARAILDKCIGELRADALPELKKDPKLRGGILGLALRAALQEGKLGRAKEILQVIQATAENPQEAGLSTILRALSKIMKEQLDEIRKKNDSEQLEKLRTGFVTFLDEMAKGQKDNSPEFMGALAQSYANLDQHAKAIELLQKVEEPKGKDADQRLVQNYHACRILLMREYRQNKQFDEAEKLIKEGLGGWGKNNLDVQMERVHLFDARGKHGAAATEWNKLNNQLVKRVKEPDIKPRYFECYFYLVRSLAWHGKKENQPKYVKQAANMIVNLERSWPDFGGEASKIRFQELLSQEKELKEQVDALKGTASN
jgi:hypothetical protein